MVNGLATRTHAGVYSGAPSRALYTTRCLVVEVLPAVLTLNLIAVSTCFSRRSASA